MFEFSTLEYDTKLLRARFGSPRAGGCPGISDASFVAHITISAVYFQYTRSRPQESYKVVSLPSIQLTPKNVSPTGGRCSTSLRRFEIEGAGWSAPHLVAFLLDFGAC